MIFYKYRDYLTMELINTVNYNINIQNKGGIEINTEGINITIPS